MWDLVKEIHQVVRLVDASHVSSYDRETDEHDEDEKIHDEEEKNDVEQEEDGSWDRVWRRQVVEVEVAE